MSKVLVDASNASVDGLEGLGVGDIPADDKPLTEEDMAQAMFEESCMVVDDPNDVDYYD